MAYSSFLGHMVHSSFFMGQSVMHADGGMKLAVPPA
jgi:hypothetical protein